LRYRVPHGFVIRINRASVSAFDGLPLMSCGVKIKRLLESGNSPLGQSPLGQLDVFPGASRVADQNDQRTNREDGLSQVHYRRIILRTNEGCEKLSNFLKIVLDKDVRSQLGLQGNRYYCPHHTTIHSQILQTETQLIKKE